MTWERNAIREYSNVLLWAHYNAFEFCKKNSIIPYVAIKVHKNNETKESTFQCHFHLPSEKNNKTKGEQSASNICISTQAPFETITTVYKRK